MKLPKVSIVIASLNGGLRIGSCLDSLNSQTYGQKLIEIIVVDDGSIDNTADVATMHGANVISLKHNSGRAAARNTGWHRAKGKIIIFLDDDCIASGDWIENLMHTFTPNVIASGGRVAAKKTITIGEKYLAAIGYGNPAPEAFGRSKKPIHRFFAYISSMINPIFVQKKPSVVQAIFTGNAGYLRSALMKLKGFDESLPTGEDTDLSNRAHIAYPDKQIMFNPNAVVYHAHEKSLWRFIKQTFIRAQDTVTYYQKDNKFPPIYPFPIILLALMLLSQLLMPKLVIPILILGPIIMYPWWLVRGIKEKNVWMPTFGYLQCLCELTEVTGIIKSLLLPKSKPGIHLRSLIVSCCILAFTSILATMSGNTYIALLIGIPSFLILPGFLLQLVSRKKLALSLSNFVYSTGLSVAFWILGGLLINTLIPILGDARPLKLVYVILLYAVSISILAGIIYRRNPVISYSQRSSRFNARTWLGIGAAVLLPILSVLGSTTLNNLGGSYLTFSMIVCICALIIYVSFNVKTINSRSLPVIVYCVALSLLLMYSMRSWHVIGWDIHDEFRIFRSTLSNERWLMSSFPHHAYNACMSVTILPSILAKLFNLSSEYLFKFLYQVLFAIVPVIIYTISRRFLAPMLSLFAAILFSTQTWFFEQMPALARQEIAIIMFILLVAVLIDTEISKKARYSLAYTFLVCLVISHYSTAYVWLMVAVFSYIIMWILRIFSKEAKLSLRLLPWHLLIMTILLLFLWEGPITHTGTHATNVASTTSTRLGDIFSPSSIKDGVQRAFISAPDTDSNATILAAQREAFKDKFGIDKNYYPAAATKLYTPKALDDRQYATIVLPSILAKITNLIALALRAVVTNLFSAFGIIILWILFLKKESKVTFEFVALSASSYLLILLMLFLPFLQENYNLTRLYLQLFTILVIPAIAAFWLFIPRNARYGLPIMSLTIVVMIMSLTGLLDQLTGGSLRITMTQPRGTFDTFYVYDDEVYAAKWFANHNVKSVPIYADVIANLRLQTYANIDTKHNDIFPSSLPKISYVYLIDANTIREHSFYADTNRTLPYNTPNEFINASKDLIYSSGGSKFYR